MLIKHGCTVYLEISTELVCLLLVYCRWCFWGKILINHDRPSSQWTRMVHLRHARCQELSLDLSFTMLLIFFLGCQIVFLSYSTSSSIFATSVISMGVSHQKDQMNNVIEWIKYWVTNYFCRSIIVGKWTQSKWLLLMREIIRQEKLATQMSSYPYKCYEPGLVVSPKFTRPGSSCVK